MSVVRASSLALAQYCGYSVKLSEEYPESSLAAEAGTDYHALFDAVVKGTTQDPAVSAVLHALQPYVTAESEVKVEVWDEE